MNRILQETGGRVLAFGAHPDDLEVGAGGLLARLSDEGAEVTMAIVALPNHAEQRKAEALAGADVIDANLFVIYEDDLAVIAPGNARDIRGAKPGQLRRNLCGGLLGQEPRRRHQNGG